MSAKVKRCSLSFTHLDECDRNCGETTIADVIRKGGR